MSTETYKSIFKQYFSDKRICFSIVNRILKLLKARDKNKKQKELLLNMFKI